MKTIGAMFGKYAMVAVLGSLSACGGGGGDGSPPRVFVQGVVAAGKPLAGYTVQLVTTDGNVLETVTDAEGRYSIEVATWRPPFSVTAYAPATEAGPWPRLHSVAFQTGTTNVTPLTDLLVIRLQQKPVLWSGSGYDDWTTLAAVTKQRVVDARQEVVDYLRTRPSKHAQSETAPVDVSAVTDFLATPFQPKAGDTYDDALERVAASLMDDETVYGLEEHMLNSTVAAATLEGIEPDSAVYCVYTVCGPNDGYANPGKPLIPLSALIKRAMLQMINTDPFLRFDCGSTPTIKGIKPGTNNFQADGTVLRINSDVDEGYSIHFASASAMSFHIDKAASSSSNLVRSMYTYPSLHGIHARAAWLKFDKDGKTVKVEIYNKRDENTWDTVECWPV